MENYEVYIKPDAEGRVVAINSSMFLKATDGWLKIDEGLTSKHIHAQTRYLPTPLQDDNGVWLYKYADGSVARRTETEIAEDLKAIEAEPSADFSGRIGSVEQQLEMLLEGVTEDEQMG